MTKYALPKETMDRYFADSRRVTNIAVAMAADQLTKDLINAFEIKRTYWYDMHCDAKVSGIDECIAHLKAFLET
jgi:hypothetical protein